LCFYLWAATRYGQNLEKKQVSLSKFHCLKVQETCAWGLLLWNSPYFANAPLWPALAEKREAGFVPAIGCQRTLACRSGRRYGYSLFALNTKPPIGLWVRGGWPHLWLGYGLKNRERLSVRVDTGQRDSRHALRERTVCRRLQESHAEIPVARFLGNSSGLNWGEHSPSIP
jgi:hypothetical protein